MYRTNTSILTLLVACISRQSPCDAFSYTPSASTVTKPHHVHTSLATLNMQQQQPGGFHEESRRLGSNLAAATTEYFIPTELSMIDAEIRTRTTIPKQSVIESFIIPVISAALMITGNTVGAGMLVLPELVAGPGLMVSFGVFFGAWLMNLISGLTIAQVAIQQHETSGSEVPSSFKEFAEATLPSAANLVSGISIFINTLIMAFDVFKAGQIWSSMVGGSGGEMLSYVWAGLLAALVSTQSLGTLSQVASVLVIGLFATFSALLLPGLAGVPDPMAVMMSDPVLASIDLDVMNAGLLHMTPVAITTLVFQNIVPTVTRLLEYDRAKIATAITLGSAVPLVMYMAWCVIVVGGGIDASSLAMGGGGIGVFSLITAAGSSLGTSMSLSEEFSIILGDEKKETFSISSVALPIAIALILGQLFSSDISDLLEITGSYGTPVLYGAIPVAMALLMQQRAAASESILSAQSPSTGPSTGMVPGGLAGLGLLAAGTTALIGTELVGTVSSGIIS
jgi:tyrosine-specific transport protein